jgi:hypothetical protein
VRCIVKQDKGGWFLGTRQRWEVSRYKTEVGGF